MSENRRNINDQHMNFHVARRSKNKINKIASCTVTYVAKITTVTDRVHGELDFVAKSKLSYATRRYFA